MVDYKYKPDYNNINEDFVNVNEYDDYNVLDQNNDSLFTEGQQEASTTLQELDEIEEIELLNKNSGELLKIPSTDNQYPDILRKPLYVSTVPEGGIIRHPVNTTNDRTRNMSNDSNNTRKSHEPPSIGNMSLNNFSIKIANSLLDIINDLLSYDGKKDFTNIFTKNDRLIAIGILLIIISIFFIFFRNIE